MFILCSFKIPTTPFIALLLRTSIDSIGMSLEDLKTKKIIVVYNYINNYVPRLWCTCSVVLSAVVDFSSQMVQPKITDLFHCCYMMG